MLIRRRRPAWVWWASLRLRVPAPKGNSFHSHRGYKIGAHLLWRHVGSELKKGLEVEIAMDGPIAGVLFGGTTKGKHV